VPGRSRRFAASQFLTLKPRFAYLSRVRIHHSGAYPNLFASTPSPSPSGANVTSPPAFVRLLFSLAARNLSSESAKETTLKHLSTAFILSFALLSNAFAGTITVVPTTTRTAQTSNNTSTSNSFTGTSNGNIAPTNISKLPIRSLLYPGATTKIYVHVQPWWGKTSHINVGYNSTDPAQAMRQVKDMISRGINGVIMDWYGATSTFNNNATLALFQAAQAHPGFEFAVGYDGGAVKGVTSPTSKVISDLKYAYNTYMQSPNYMRKNGRPVVTFFSMSKYSIDWNKVRASVPGNPLFIFRNSGGFTETQSNGSFAWIGISSDPNSMGLSYLANFYKVATSHEPKLGIASAYKGFNDSLASWGEGRKVNQQCGQTWLATLAQVGKHYSASHQLDSLQLNTWNDYEEGSALEPGIDNCVTVSASISGSTLYWRISGQENTIHHYNIYIHNGKGMMKFAEQRVGIRSMNLSGYEFAPGTYTIYVQAIGKPSLKNNMSNGVTIKR